MRTLIIHSNNIEENRFLRSDSVQIKRSRAGDRDRFSLFSASVIFVTHFRPKWQFDKYPEAVSTIFWPSSKNVANM